jgi:hypothetical protein
MTTRIRGTEPINAVSTVGEALDGTAIGVKLSYVCPAGKAAVARFVSISTIAQAITIALEIIVGGVTVEIGAFTTSQQLSIFVPLNAGDTVQLDVTVAVALGAFDAVLAVEEYLVS